MRRPVFLFLTFFSLCLASTLYLFGGSATAAELSQSENTYGKGRYAPSVYQQHLDEALKNQPALASHIALWEAKQAENQKLLQASHDYLAHINTYFLEAKAEAEMIQDSALRAQVLDNLATREAAVQVQTASLRKTLADSNTLMRLAADYKKAAEVMGSLSSFDTYLQTSKVDTSSARKALLNNYNLIEAGKALVDVAQ